jgi:DNA-binding XRE family transcriptional regulator
VVDHQTFYEEVGRRIQGARKHRKPKLTQEALAKMVSLTRTSITNVEKGRQKFLLHTLVDIARSLGVDPASLLPDVSSESEHALDKALKDRSPSVKQWVKSAVSAAQREKNNGSA